MNQHRVAVVQMDTTENLKDNLKKIELMVERAVKDRAELVCFPEMVNIQTGELTAKEKSEPLAGKTISLFKELAGKHGIWICCGTILETIENDDKVYNTAVLVGRDGTIKATYSKRHTFDITMKDGYEYRESDTVKAGEKITVVDTPFGRVGFGICYDLRFPEQFREMTAMGMEILILPACFTKETGKAHWDTLVRARAIENGCYILASDQCGFKYNGDSYGHSMIVDPWGEVIKVADEEENILVADIDLDYVAGVREQIPATVNR